MRAIACFALLACGSPPTPAHTPVVSTVPPAVETVEAVAMKLMRDFIACDEPAARSLIATFDELRAMSNNVHDSGSDYDGEVIAFVADRCREMHENNAKLVDAKTTRTRRLRQADEPDRLRHDVDLAFVQYRFEIDGEARDAGAPMLFVRTDRGWKLSLDQ